MSKKILIGILVTAALLRILNLSSGDPVNDEVFMSFRGLGMMDFDEAAVQPTPWELWESGGPSNGSGPIPWWMHLSFHDHPLLVPLTQNISMKLFGESNFGFRLPSAILGIASVYLLYLLGSQLYSKNVGLWAAGIFAVTLNNVYISRTGMQESYVIFFLLLASYLFLKSLQNPCWLITTGAAIGLGLSAKYTAFIEVPIFLTYLVIFRRSYFINKNFWLGAAIAVILFSPSLIYNVMLYKTFGHFDFQISHVFGRVPEYWQVAPGKEIGSFTNRLQNFIPRLVASNSWSFLSLVAVSAIAFIITLRKNPKEKLTKNSFLLLSALYFLFLLLLIGPSYRFLTMLTPFLALIIGIFINSLLSRPQTHINILKYVSISKSIYIFVSIVIAFEIFYTTNNQLTNYPVNQSLWLASKVRYENYNWGYNQLGEWLEKELAGKMPALTFDLQYQFLENLRATALERGLKLGLEPYPALLVYEGNFDAGARLWVLDRLHIYHGWPILNLQTYYNYLRENGTDYYDRVGFQNRYFIFQTNIVLSPENRALMQGEPEIIRNPRGDEVFRIYKF